MFFKIQSELQKKGNSIHFSGKTYTAYLETAL